MAFGSSVALVTWWCKSGKHSFKAAGGGWWNFLRSAQQHGGLCVVCVLCVAEERRFSFLEASLGLFSGFYYTFLYFSSAFKEKKNTLPWARTRACRGVQGR